MTSRRNISFFRTESGQAAVEFALIAPVLIALLLGILQSGIAFSHYLTVTDAARAGGRKAVLLRVGNLTPSDVATAVQQAAPGLKTSQLGISVSDPTDPTFQQSGSTVQVTVTYPYAINVLGWVVSSGSLSSTMSERLE